jgi:hypothetical protein
MKRTTSFGIALAISFLVFSVFEGCRSASAPAEPSSIPTGLYNYQFEAANLQSLGDSYGQYFLWLRMIGDSTAIFSVPLTNPKQSNDSLVFSGIIKLPHNPDSILSAVVSIESGTLPSGPTSTLMAGQFQSDSGYSFLSGTNAGAAGDYSNAIGSVVFTTKSADTSRAQKEFYLMKFVNGVPISSMSNLPIAPVGWRYGLWVIDSSFYPIHKFFYGSFTNPNGPGSDSIKAEFPFPGGYNPAPLNDPGASLKVTLEPEFSVAGNKPTGPSPVTILSLELPQFIYFDQSIQFQNVWSGSAPAGILRIWKR